MIAAGYITQSPDTCIEAELVQFELWRKLSAIQKLSLVKRIARQGSQLALMGIYHQFPHASDDQVKQLYLEKRWSRLALNIKKIINFSDEFMLEDPIWLAQKLGSLLDTLQIPYYVGGSVASSLQGEVRFTEDLDLAIALQSEQISPLIEALKLEFYVSEVAVMEAIRGETTSFNVIHFATTEKADIFMSRGDPFEQSKMARRQLYSSDDPATGFYVCSPEDAILQKLLWFALSHNQSQKQWRDILGVLKLQRERLDFAYLGLWSENLGVQENLLKAMIESGLSGGTKPT